MKTRLLVVALAATASLAACGAEDPASNKTTGAQPSRQDEARKAMLDYAKCMREHGVDMPDPQFDGGRVMQKGPKKVNEAKMREADQACASIRDRVKPPEISDEEKAEFKKAALEHSKCMREHGVDFPDPTFDENGGGQVRIGRGSGINPESPKFKAAEKACQDKMPGAGKTDNEEG
jgi:hypothetical protein